MKKLIYIMLLTTMVWGATGCKKFLDVNENPNNPTEESLKDPNLLLSSSLTRIAAQTATSYASTARWMGYWSRSGSYGPNPDEEAYRITTTFEAGEWTTWLDIMFDVYKMEQKAVEKGGQEFYIGAAKVLKTIGYMYLVDQYNNVPYSKAFQDIRTNLFPAYDKGQDIYNDLFVQLDEALAIFQGLDGVSEENEKFDILFGGDLDLWEEFINTQRLKLSLRMANVSGFNASAQMAKITTKRFLKETASVQPGYVQDQNQQNPYWNTFKSLYDGSNADNFNRANNYILSKFRDNNDPRFMRVFSPNGGTGTNYTGFNYGEVISNAPTAGNSANVAGPGLAKSASQPQWIFSSVESKFLQAEAIARGWISDDNDAHEALIDAVRESFVWLGLTADDADEYLGQPDDENVTDYDQLLNWPASQADQIRFIGMHKYLALIGINNFEAWVDYRRIGVPTDLPLSMHPGRGNNIIPLRLHYPQNEYNFNPTVVAAEGTIDPQSSKIFWDVN
ncbi:SusD/RagB family nutrient-binding outer membrane lipoprotein [Niabella yanshanensis]|uniref:SusD/RagB family nutrient-binding outer membrane lipoprotein n=1 Tax=Niabella yanshanensis TaxID=577386 RepID=A0ABZ0W1V7_9BACT|nr:SusD/RagB family nutrient-binding outer membrane lipoprotein [Niabella yanshanensis]WQD37250.1 SusD/RagB family nutrient-binding outer membrane lipoprotein [Niabella yanshanensis]